MQIDGISPTEASRLSNLLPGATNGRGDNDQPLRTRTIYDEERACLEIIVVGGLPSGWYFLLGMKRYVGPGGPYALVMLEGTIRRRVPKGSARRDAMLSSAAPVRVES